MNIKAVAILCVGLLLIGAGFVTYFEPWNQDKIEWNLRLIGREGQQVDLSYYDVKELQFSIGNGGFVTTAGIVYGPYVVKGVSIEDLCALVGGINTTDTILISAEDGYSILFDYDMIENIPTFDPDTMDEVPHERLGLIIFYEQDGEPLSSSDGKPLRLGVVGSEPLLTEGFYWVKWVNQVQVIIPEG